MSQSTSYNVDDPRFAGIRNTIAHTLIGPVDTAYGHQFIKRLYYASGAVDRSNQSTASTYNKAVQTAANILDPAPCRVMYQYGNHYDQIQRGEIEEKLLESSQAFIHLKKIEVNPATRLYIPCHLTKVGAFMQRLWECNGLKAFKVVGYAGATGRADVIVASFQHNQHARAVGESFDQLYAADLSGTFPIGAYPCSNANLCGWALDDGVSSVGTDAVADLKNWWEQIRD